MRMSRFEHLADIEGQFLQACINGDIEEAREMLDGGVSVHVSSYPQDWNGLMRASMNGHTALVRMLIERNANIESKANDGRSALHFACLEGHNDTASALIEMGAQLEARSNLGLTPLMYAARRINMETIVMLILKGADTTAVDISNRSVVGLLGKSSHITGRERQAAIKTINCAQQAYTRTAAWKSNIREILPFKVPLSASFYSQYNEEKHNRVLSEAVGNSNCRGIGEGKNVTNRSSNDPRISPHGSDDNAEEELPSAAYIRARRAKGWTVGRSRWAMNPTKPAAPLCKSCHRAASACLCELSMLGE